MQDVWTQAGGLDGFAFQMPLDGGIQGELFVSDVVLGPRAKKTFTAGTGLLWDDGAFFQSAHDAADFSFAHVSAMGSAAIYSNRRFPYVFPQSLK